MNIFHIGKTFKNIEYEHCKPNNLLKATIPHSLNQTDFSYYMEILFQYVDQVKHCNDIEQAKKKFMPININMILKNLNMSSGGKSYHNFEASLNKLSNITLLYHKKITFSGLYSTDKDTLISYKILSHHSRQNQGKSSVIWRKLSIKMHPIILDMIKEANFNYSLLNKNSYRKMHSSKLKLFYYYFCCLILPGQYPIKLSIDDILSLWPKTKFKQVINQRKKEIVEILKIFVKLDSQLEDLDSQLIYRNNEVIGIQLKKTKLLLV